MIHFCLTASHRRQLVLDNGLSIVSLGSICGFCGAVPVLMVGPRESRFGAIILDCLEDAFGCLFYQFQCKRKVMKTKRHNECFSFESNDNEMALFV